MAGQKPRKEEYSANNLLIDALRPGSGLTPEEAVIKVGNLTAEVQGKPPLTAKDKVDITLAVPDAGTRFIDKKG